MPEPSAISGSGQRVARASEAAERAPYKIRSCELAERVGITEQYISLLESGKVKGIRFETLAKIFEVLDCPPGDLLEALPEGEAWGGGLPRRTAHAP